MPGVEAPKPLPQLLLPLSGGGLPPEAGVGGYRLTGGRRCKLGQRYAAEGPSEVNVDGDHGILYISASWQQSCLSYRGGWPFVLKCAQDCSQRSRLETTTTTAVNTTRFTMSRAPRP